MTSIKDWSLEHGPSGKLFQPVKNKADWATYKLTNQQIDTFWKDGFLNHIPLLSVDQCDAILKEYDIFMSENGPGEAELDLLYEFHRNQSGDVNNVLMHALGHWRLSPLFHDLVFLPSAVVKASQLLLPDREAKVRFWHDQLFAKPAKHGGVVAWHQDYSYWTRTQPMQHLTIHIALEDQTEENGTLEYIPGSHRWTRQGGPLPVLDFNFKDMEGIKKGEASIHHPLSVHGSYGNRSDKARRSAVLNYFADGTRSDTNEQLLKGSLVPKGEEMGSQLYPLVYDPEWFKDGK
ncbi:hypothetical protein RRG08_039232 [Elysia crispata]|uniref:Phytanoyl-CoA dioxygenase n=1 Tax=Elysia crispata TaxID=231223 RepID=A0AAE1BFA5_9GAST|nr:hypothetical protein RRG08_039232 [Elysia crispata]